MPKFSANKPPETNVYKSEKLGIKVKLSSTAINNVIRAKRMKKPSKEDEGRFDRVDFMNSLVKHNPLITSEERRLLWDELFKKPLAVLNGLKTIEKEKGREV